MRLEGNPPYSKISTAAKNAAVGAPASNLMTGFNDDPIRISRPLGFWNITLSWIRIVFSVDDE